MKKAYKKRNIKKIKRKNGISKNTLKIVDESIPEEHALFESSHPLGEDSLTQYYRSYIFPIGSDQMKVIGFSTFMSRDSILENVFIRKILDNQIPDSIHVTTEINNINFVNREIALGSACHWVSAHNVQCPKLGQISWSEFRSMDRAKEFLDKRIRLTKNINLQRSVKESSVEVIFEGIETSAKKMIIKAEIPNVGMIGSIVLIVYNLVQEIDNKFVACTMSHFRSDANYPKMPPLIARVMKLK